MLHACLADAKFWRLLLAFDEDLAAEARAAGCRYCGGVLHSAPYPRKPRGVAHAVLGAAGERRLSLCCAREGCRRRTTPGSVRFLGRRVYLGAVVVLASALAQGPTPWSRAQLREHFGVGAWTLRRWRRWWWQVFPATPFWRTAQGRFLPPVAVTELPLALLERFEPGEAAAVLTHTLAFLTPWSRRLEQAR